MFQMNEYKKDRFCLRIGLFFCLLALVLKKQAVDQISINIRVIRLPVIEDIDGLLSGYYV